MDNHAAQPKSTEAEYGRAFAGEKTDPSKPLDPDVEFLTRKVSEMDPDRRAEVIDNVLALSRSSKLGEISGNAAGAAVILAIAVNNVEGRSASANEALEPRFRSAP